MAEDLFADVFADALTGWDSLKAEDGSTAADLAEKSGAPGINAMIRRKQQGEPSGVWPQQFDFDPDTGEWIDDSVDSSHSESQTDDRPAVTETSDDPAPLLVPVMPNHSMRLTPDEASRLDVPRKVTIENPDGVFAMSSPSSSGAGGDLRRSEDFGDVLHKGLHRRGKLVGLDGGVYSDNDQVYLDQNVHGKNAVPRVFDAQAALLSSAVVGAVGVCALGLRFCFECYDI